jgi:membrane protease YdiL (CAAX protease family)
MPDENKKLTAPLKNISPIAFVVIALMVVFITYQIFGGILSSFILKEQDGGMATGNITLTRIIVSFSQFMFILVPVVLMNMLRGDGFTAGFKFRNTKISYYALSFIGMLAIQPLLQYILVLQNKIIFSLPFGQDSLNSIKNLYDYFESFTNSLVVSSNIGEFIFVTFVIALTPAICEEFMFRGLILSNLEKLNSSKIPVIFTGLLFAIFHFHPFNIIPLIILGIFISYIAYYSGSIFPAIMVHFVNNFLSALAIFIMGKDSIDDSTVTWFDIAKYTPLAVVSLIIFIFVLIFIKKIYEQSKTE